VAQVVEVVPRRRIALGRSGVNPKLGWRRPAPMRGGGKVHVCGVALPAATFETLSVCVAT
jgi:hypothetical protein